MIEIPFYESFEKKQEDFDCKKIETIKDLDDFISEQENYDPKNGKSGLFSVDDLFPPPYFIYRGIKESKFRLNTSFQLRYDEITYFHPSIFVKDYLSQMVVKLKDKELINESGLTDIGIVALMQHYGLPTPFMDWTPNIRIALNFAYDGIDMPIDMPNHDNDISQYVSLYYIDLIKNYELSAASYQKIIVDGKQQIEMILQDCSLDGVDCSAGSLNNLFGIKDIDTDFIYIEYFRDSNYIKDIFGIPLDINNPNILKQKGAFIINSKEKEFLNDLWNNKNNQYESATGIIPQTKIKCVNIRKDVLKQWIESSGMIELYDNSEESKKYKRIVLSTYYNWLLDGKHEEKDKTYFRDTFVVKGSDVSKEIANEVLSLF